MQSDSNPQSSRSCRICDGELIELFPFGDSPKVVRCRSCRTESLRPLPTPEELEAHYTNYEVTNTPEEQVNTLINLSMETLRFYLGEMELKGRSLESIRLLEIGFGNGAGMFAASKLGMQAYGVDLDSAGTARAQSYANQHSLPVTCVCGDVDALRDFKLEFDIVKASQILEHVIDPHGFLSSIAEVQPAGGYLIIECPNNEAMFWALKNRTRKSFNRMNYYNSLKLKEHLWGYTKKSLPILLKKAGYSVVFSRDYASGDAIFEPQSVLWYPTLTEGLKDCVRQRSLHFLIYPTARALDTLFSTLLRSGTSLAVLCRKDTDGRC
jgi:2-polyprenyl-3-methyl-5-hydroxy-6-metoxy-1,4-benzoquinol methylase